MFCNRLRRIVIMISVVIATYNGEKYIEEQLDSIKNQSIKPDEVIIRDDKSSDSTPKIVREYIKKNNLNNWNFEVNGENKGYKKNFYDLLKIAKGNFIFLSDQDDVWVNEKIRYTMDEFSNNPQVLALNTGIQLVDEKLNKIIVEPKKNFYNANFLYSEKELEKLTFFKFEDLLRGNMSPGCSMCITAELRDKFVESYNFVLAHDWYMNFLASLDGGCAFFNKNLVKYRIHRGNAIGLSSKDDIRSKLLALHKDNQLRIRRTRELFETFQNISKNYTFDNQTEKSLRQYFNMRISFMEHPSLRNILRLRKLPNYYKLTTKRARLWDLIIAIHIDNLLIR